MDWEAFEKGTICVHCDTEEKAKAFLSECEKRGYKWGNTGRKPTSETHWDEEREQTVYFGDRKRISFSDVEYAKGESYASMVEYNFNTSIKDSGSRREFETGAVRDIQEGKGRCDLMPLDVIAAYMNDAVLLAIHSFRIAREKKEGDGTHYLHEALDAFMRLNPFKDVPTMMLEVAIHFEEGAKKYGENNWQKGLPVNCYIDSAVRHYLKYLRGDTDERHDRSFVWNILCMIWEVKHHES